MKTKVKFLATLLVSALMLMSCGPTVKVKVQGTKDGVNITTTQSASDSTALNIEVNPNINFNSIPNV